MNWETFYFICFLCGLFLSAFSLLGGMGHFGTHFGGHVSMPHVSHLPVAGHFPGASAHPLHLAQGAGRAQVGSGGSIPWWNTFSLMIFLCWFGAAGYLLTRYGSFLAAVVVVLAILCGVAGGAIVFFFLTRVMLPHEHELTADETDVVGVVGQVSSPIREGGIGEILYQQLGARQSVPARSENGVPIARDEEVFVVRFEKGVAYVRRWEEVLEEETGIRDQRSGVRE